MIIYRVLAVAFVVIVVNAVTLQLGFDTSTKAPADVYGSQTWKVDGDEVACRFFSPTDGGSQPYTVRPGDSLSNLVVGRTQIGPQTLNPPVPLAQVVKATAMLNHVDNPADITPGQRLSFFSDCGFSG